MTDCVRLLDEGDATIGDGLVQAFDRDKAAVGERFIGKEPQMFGRLQLGAVGGLEYEADPSGTAKLSSPVPAGIVSWSTIRLSGPAPTDLAKSARMTSNNSLQPASAIFDTVRPVVGSTNPVATRNDVAALPREAS